MVKSQYIFWLVFHRKKNTSKKFYGFEVFCDNASKEIKISSNPYYFQTNLNNFMAIKKSIGSVT